MARQQVDERVGFAAQILIGRVLGKLVGPDAEVQVPDHVEGVVALPGEVALPEKRPFRRRMPHHSGLIRAREEHGLPVHAEAVVAEGERGPLDAGGGIPHAAGALKRRRGEARVLGRQGARRAQHVQAVGVRRARRERLPARLARRQVAFPQEHLGAESPDRDAPPPRPAPEVAQLEFAAHGLARAVAGPMRA